MRITYVLRDNALNCMSLILLLLLCTIGFASCNKDDTDRWYDKMHDGGPFHTGNALRFFYVDEEGNDLIDPTDLSTLPISYAEELDIQPDVPESLRNGTWYNNEQNCISYNKEKNLYEFFTFAYGDSRYNGHTFNVYFKGKADRMEVTFKYQSDKVNAGKDYLSMVTSWSVNGELIYTDKEITYLKHIYLIKKSDGTTSIAFD